MTAWFAPGLLAALAGLRLMPRTAAALLRRRLARRIYAEVASHRLGPHRRLDVKDRAWVRNERLLYRLDPDLAREVAAYYRLAREAAGVLEEPVPMRLASAPGRLVHFMRRRRLLMNRLLSMGRLKAPAAPPSNRPRGGLEASEKRMALHHR